MKYEKMKEAVEQIEAKKKEQEFFRQFLEGKIIEIKITAKQSDKINRAYEITPDGTTIRFDSLVELIENEIRDKVRQWEKEIEDLEAE